MIAGMYCLICKRCSNPVSGDVYLFIKPQRYKTKVFNELKQGKIRWYDAVDLHGATIEEPVKPWVNWFCRPKNNENCVKIIHGKGIDSILKLASMAGCVRFLKCLLFAPVPAAQGGNGAVLVLLKNVKKPIATNNHCTAILTIG